MKKLETIPEFIERLSPEIPLERFNIHTFIDNILEIDDYQYYNAWHGRDIKLIKVSKYKLTMNANGDIKNYIRINN